MKSLTLKNSLKGKFCQIISAGIIFILLSSALYSQDCRSLLLDYIGRMSAFRQPENSKVYYMNLHMSYSLWDKVASIPDVDAKLFVAGKAYFFESDQLSIYYDEKDLICLNHAYKQVILSESQSISNFEQTNTIEQLIKMQQDLILKSNFLSCKDTTVNSVQSKIAILIPGDDMQLLYKLSRLTYYYSLATNRISKVKIEYKSGNKIKWQILEYKEISFDYPGWKATKARQMIFDSAGKLLPKYNHYSLIDNRK